MVLAQSNQAPTARLAARPIPYPHSIPYNPTVAEDKGNEEEKFDFTGEGEAVGYISLEQARVLAIRTARETPGEYVSSYQDMPMALEVSAEQDTEDYYRVTLSFRPQGDFSGRPGQEQFSRKK